MGEIKKGYKQSEFGLIPEDWKLCTFKDVLSTFSSGATPYRGIPEYYKGDIRWISSGELNYNIINETTEHISELAIKNTNLKTHSPGTFLMAVTGLEAEGTRGRCAIVGLPSTTNQSCLAINSTGRMTTEYLFWFYRQWSEYLAFKYCQGTKQQSYTAALVKELPICCPKETTEQTAIAIALSDVDALIAALDKKITKKQQIKQGAMQQLLTGKKRLPGFSGNSGFKQTELGLIPEDWEVKKLGDIGEPIIGLTYKPENVKSEGILVLRSSNIQENKLSFDDNVFVNVEVSDRIITRNGDILICVRNGSRELIGKSAVIKGKAVGQTFGAFMSVYRTDYSNYVSHLFNSELIKIQIDQHLGATINQITNKSLSSFSIPLPPTLSEQNSIAQILTDMDDEIVQLLADRDKYEQIKAGMMQQLLTGKIRLCD